MGIASHRFLPRPSKSAETLRDAPPGRRQGSAEPSADTRRERFESDFDALVRAHFGRLCSFVHRYVGSRATAEDIVQELFTRIWQRQDSLGDGDPLPYLYRAARNNALMHLRHERVHERWRAGLESAAEPTATPEPAGDLDELSAAIAAAVAALPDRCRLIFTMHREQDLRYADIARALGISVKTVETQMGRAMRSLRMSLAAYLPSGVIALIATIPPRLFE